MLKTEKQIRERIKELEGKRSKYNQKATNLTISLMISQLEWVLN